MNESTNKNQIPVYEYFITATWIAIAGTIGLTQIYKWEMVAWIVLVILILFVGSMAIFRRAQWKQEAWEGRMQSKQKKPTALLLPFMKSVNEITISSPDGTTFSTRVSRGIYSAVTPNQYLTKKAGEQDVVFYDNSAPTPAAPVNE